MVTRLDNFMTPINIVNIYGEQESRTSKEELEDNWNEVLEILADIDAKSEAALVVGDLNKKVGNMIKNNHPKVSVGKEMIKELIGTGKYILVNAIKNAVGGPFKVQHGGPFVINNFMQHNLFRVITIQVNMHNTKYIGCNNSTTFSFPSSPSCSFCFL